MNDYGTMPGFGAMDDLVDARTAAEMASLEDELDARIARKQMQIAEAAFRTTRARRTLRLTLSHSVEEVSGVLSWTLRLTGRVAGGLSGRAPRALSNYVRAVVVEAGDEAVEWVRRPGTPETDGFEVRRASGGSAIVPVRVHVALDHQPERLRMSAPLAAVVGPVLPDGAASRAQVVLALWQYVRAHRLQESDEKKVVVCDGPLRALLGAERVPLAELPLRLEAHLSPAPPLVLEYTVDASRPTAAGPEAHWDADVDVVDEAAALRAARPGVVPAAVAAHLRDISAADTRLLDTLAALRASEAQHALLARFAEDPAGAMRRLLDAHARDMAVASVPSATPDGAVSPWDPAVASGAAFSADPDVLRAVSVYLSARP